MRCSQRSTGVNRTQFSLKLVLSCLFISALAWMGLSTDLPSDDCEPKDCGDGRNISYPFWIKDRQSPSCGYPAFKLACKNSAAVLKIYDDDYLVHNIFYSNRSLVVSSLELVGSCPVPRYSFSLGGTQFSINPTNRYISFFLNCTELVSGYRIGCPRGGNQSGSFVGNYSSPEQARLEYGRKNCESFVVWPYRADGGAGGDGNYSARLDNGFLLDWDAVDCSACKASGGRCRYDLRWSRFACVCSDRSHAVSCQGGNKTTKVAIGVGVGAAGFFLVSFICLLLYRRKKMKARTGSSTLFFRTASSELSSKKDPEMGSSHYLTHLFEYEELHEATDGFNPSNELGDGGFGTVYKGKLRDGRIVAVKRLYENNWKRVEQFKNEVGILNRLRHQNLVTLYGCTSRHSRELLLVYEYIPNGTVADHLHGPRAPEGALTWPIRLNIAVETATALAYLHAVEPQIIHRDVKTNNILLDNNFHVKVADFGLSRLFPTDVTHVSTAPQGTPGYVDPEYHQCYQLTDKSDVYSFGVVLVELISSMPAVDITRHRHEINLSNMAINKIQNDALHELVDPGLGFETDWEARRMIKLVAELAFRCLQAEKEMRPSMEDVVEVLQGIQSHDQAAEREGDVDDGAKDDMSLLKSNVPPSPDSVMDKWSSRTTTPNTSG